MIFMGPLQLEIFYNLCMDFSQEHKLYFCSCFGIVLCLFFIFLCVSGSSDTLPAPSCSCQGFVLVVRTETAAELDFIPQRVECCFTRVSIPGTKGQGCLFLPLLSPCQGPHCCQSLAALPKSGSSSLENQTAQSAAVPASFHWGFSLSLRGPFGTISAC